MQGVEPQSSFPPRDSTVIMPEPLLLIPGLNCTEEAFVPLLPQLWAHGSVMLVNHRRGGSMADIARAVLAEAPPRFALLGFSMGGYIAMEILRQAPDRVTRICFLSTTAAPDTAEQAENRRRMVQLAEGGRFDLVAGANFPNVVHPESLRNAPLQAAHLRMARLTGAEVYVDQQTAILDRPDSRSMLPGITVPTAVIVGEADQVTGVAGAEELAANVPGATLSIIPGAGHLLPLERPGAASAAIVSWLTRRA